MITECTHKTPVNPGLFRPGLVIHNRDCSLSLLMLSAKPDEQAGKVYDWDTNTEIPRYPAIMYLRGSNETSTGSYPMPGAIYHVAERQRLGLGGGKA